ncbi:MAG TPA: DUF503 domain-containing protein [Nocardioidaceae bacterium]|nr:DUF503 domain-containing protein [Nocardioidaceae bacterium]
MFVGMAAFELLLHDAHSLKQKRSVVRPIVAELQRRFGVAVSETGHHDLYRRTQIGIAVVSGGPGHCTEVLDTVERWLAGRPEADLLSARRQLRSIDDE